MECVRRSVRDGSVGWECEGWSVRGGSVRGGVWGGVCGVGV